MRIQIRTNSKIKRQGSSEALNTTHTINDA